MIAVDVVDDQGQICSWWLNFHRYIDSIELMPPDHYPRVDLINKHLVNYEMLLNDNGSKLYYKNVSGFTAFLLRWS